MSIYDETLWKYLEEKVREADECVVSYKKCGSAYLTGMRELCDYAVSLAKTIRDVFPLYTLHDETHICSVMQKMEQLLGDQLEQLSRDEAAMLILAACCHDLGMSYSDQQIKELLDEGERLEQYLEDHPDAYVRLNDKKKLKEIPDDLFRDFLRSIHHERVNEILLSWDWPNALLGNVNCEDLIQVCQSHGRSADEILGFESDGGIDLRMCAILLRLADILDFDTSRAPQAVYFYSGFDQRVDPASRFSREEWEKHKASRGFAFHKVKNRTYPYDLPYDATCHSMKIEQAINSYIDWVDSELAACQTILRHCDDTWRNLVLPRKIKRKIIAKGYLSGQFCLTLDQEKVVDLLIGRNLYQDPGVFVRELLQNAIDAVRTREKLDKHLPRGWKPQINIRCWMDNEGYHWFRIEDNGIGMDRKIIENYFLKVGRSYYASSDFQQEKLRNRVEEYTPISRFGIGILSCFMGDKEANQVEITTKRYTSHSQALRMSMHGISGYYYLTNKDVCSNPVEMKGVTPEEKRAYRKEPGTAIAVRTNLYQTGKYHSFREILDQYVAYPPVAVHYEDENGSHDYPTEQALMDAMHAVSPSADPEKRGVLEFVPTPEQIQKLEREIPGLKIVKPPKVTLKCCCLDQCSESKLLTGAVLLAKVDQGISTCTMQFGSETVEAESIGFYAKRNGHHLQLRASINLPSAFRRKMDMLRNSEKEILEKQERSGFGIQMKFVILSGVLEGYDSDMDWHEYVQNRHGISADQLQNEVASMKAQLSVNGIDFATYRDYRKYRENCNVTLCDLAQYSWYERFWKDLLAKKNNSIAAHNGVQCGDAGFFLCTGETRAAILLLKDGYRPELDVARVKVQQLPLAAQLEFELLKRGWEQQGFDPSRGDLEEANYWRIPCQVYDALMEERSDLVKKLRFETDEGTFSPEELAGKLREHDILEWTGDVSLSSSRGYSKNRFLYEYFCLAYLRKTHALRGDYTSYGSQKLLIMPKTDPREQDDGNAFPPSFFLPVVGDENYLSRDDAWYREFCNEAHPLSQFLIRNRAELQRFVPGLFWEIMGSLANDDGEEIVEKVNDCLNRIRSLPGNKLEVPADAFLKKSDFK